MTSIINFRTTLAAGICAIIGYLVYINQEQVSHAIGIAATVLFALAVLLVVGFALLYWKRETNRHARLEDGSHALLKMKMEGGAVAVIDPNLMPAGAGIFHPRHGWMQVPPADWAGQFDYAKIVQATRSLEAIHPGDQAQMRTHGAINQPRMPANVTKMLTTAKEPKPLSTPAVIVTQPAAPPRLSLTDALGQSTGSRWIVGQGDDGQIAAFEPARHAHAAIVGATGTGKTRSVGYALALGALRAGWHVVILDPDGGADWSPFASHAEWHESDRSNFPGQIETLHAFYERRAGNPRPILIVIEEYGDLIRQLRTASRSSADQVDAWLDSILQRGRKRRMHMALIDQYPEHWTQPVIGGTKFRAVFQLGPGQGSKMEEYKAAQLADVGRFLVRGVEYNSFDASAALPALLRQLPAPSSARRVINGTASRVPMSSPISSPVSSPAPLQEVDPPSLPASEPTEPAAVSTGSTQATDIQAQAIAYIAANPTATQTDLMRALTIAKSYANELWHTHNPQGKNYQLPTGTMDMTNDTDRQHFEQLLRAGAVTFSEPKEKR